MAYNTTVSVSQVMNQAIRDTNPFTGQNFLLDQLNQTVIMIANSTDQSVSITTKWSPDGVVPFIPIGNTATITAGGTLVANQYDTTLTGLKMLVGQLQIVATAAVAPTLGTVNAWIQGMME